MASASTQYGHLTTEVRFGTRHGVLRMDDATEARWSQEIAQPGLRELFRLLAVLHDIEVLAVEGDGYLAEKIEVTR